MRFHADRLVEPPSGSRIKRCGARRATFTDATEGRKLSRHRAGGALPMGDGQSMDTTAPRRLRASFASSGGIGFLGMQSCANAASSTPSSTTRGGRACAPSAYLWRRGRRGVRRPSSPRFNLMLASRRRRGRCSLCYSCRCARRGDDTHARRSFADGIHAGDERAHIGGQVLVAVAEVREGVNDHKSRDRLAAATISLTSTPAGRDGPLVMSDRRRGVAEAPRGACSAHRAALGFARARGFGPASLAGPTSLPNASPQAQAHHQEALAHFGAPTPPRVARAERPS